ncbi:DUF4199 domain-containing protein [Mucilaginibacter jinjuensis]|uniref:DUF4199 domain-containing protein n=1 Tax=Mucilaginibacter jinjuensis TaxID=1176721 RepID=A0ABY7TEG2_9SPHI|nr:DUF4199 domain-containing protein [Mucilaginibacter jinjuensis]WCT14748.1 DUF4199 domain-containing protein [Mucilaginibacter jinjuensis]
MKVTDQELRKKAAGTGVLLGLVVMVLSIFSFYFITSIATSFWLVSFGPLIFSVTLPIIVAVLFCIDLRKKIGGYWNFRQAVTGFFVMFLVCYAINYVGTNLLFAKVIEPHMVEKTQDAVIKASEEMMEKQGVDQAQIDDRLESVKKKFEEQRENTPAKIASNFGISLIFIFVISMIFAAILKKDPPLFDTAALQEQDPIV